MIPVYRQLFEYNHWANRAYLDLLAGDSELGGRPRAVLAHILGTQQIWLARLKRESAAEDLAWPDWTYEQCAERLEQLVRDWEAYLLRLNLPILYTTVAYTNAAGEVFETRISDILMQVVQHAAYHRGQLAVWLREAGRTPPQTDYVHYLRLG